MFRENNAGVTFAKGFKACGIKAGIKKSGKDDLAIIYSEVPASAAGTFTQNKFAAAPVWVSKAVAQKGAAQAIVVNAGCANACTGEQGMSDAKETAAAAAEALGISADSIFIASTGIIGQTLPMDKMKAGVKNAAGCLDENGSDAASKAIMTTDTHPKACSTTLTIGGREVRIGAIAKGSGMIHPNMATMLCFITTDVNIEADLLQKALSECINVSLNMVTIDGDTSTNDMALIMANGMAGNAKITEENADYHTLKAAMQEILVGMAKEIAKDGEGATKFLEINIKQAESFESAKKIGMSIAHSPLVKTAFFGEDPNWGRIICAAGYSGEAVVPEKTVVSIGGMKIFANGLGVAYDEEGLKKIMEQHEIIIDVEINSGDENATVWTSDLTYEYVKINGEYHT